MAKKSLNQQVDRTPRFKDQATTVARSAVAARGYMRKFGLCRICFRERALQGEPAGRDEVELVR